MRWRVRRIGRLCLLACTGLPAAADDWPRWRGPANDGHIPAGVPVPKALPAEPKEVWKVPVGDGLGSPVASGGKVFLLDHQEGREVVHALDAATGKEAWRAPLDEVFKDNQSVPGPRSTPVVDGDRVYVQSCRGEFRCLRVADGKPVWGVNFVKDFQAVFIGEQGQATGASRHGYTGSALVDGERLYVGVGGPAGASLVCFNKADGKVIWKSQNDVPGYAGPVLATIAGVRHVVSFTAEGVIGLDAATGALLWREPMRTAFGRHVTTPVVVGDTVIVSSHQVGLVGVRVTKAGETVKAERAWTEKASAINVSSPVAVGAHIYGLGPGKKLVCVEARTGRQAWAQKEFANQDHASFLVAGDRILALTDGGQLVLFAADPSAYREVGRAQVCGKTWCNPAYAGGRLFLRDDRSLRCVQLVP